MRETAFLEELLEGGLAEAGRALAQLLGEEHSEVGDGDASDAGAGDEIDPEAAGIFFEVTGGPGGVLALLFARRDREAIARTLTGCASATDAGASALLEVANIVVSKLVSAVGSAAGKSLVPSVPRFVARGALELAALEPGTPSRVDRVIRSRSVRIPLVWLSTRCE
jgi:chemotaxis protein CheY-P-specific phosphatase CheC